MLPKTVAEQRGGGGGGRRRPPRAAPLQGRQFRAADVFLRHQ